jgi:hypothetical protein
MQDEEERLTLGLTASNYHISTLAELSVLAGEGRIEKVRRNFRT